MKPKRVQDKCEGVCEGIGTALLYYGGACPSPCDKERLARAVREAKLGARQKAISACMAKGGPECLCVGGKWYEMAAGCMTCEVPKLPENSSYKKWDKLCCYYAVYLYVGECKFVP